MLQALKRKIITKITKFYDPIVKVQIGNQVIQAPLSHQLTEITERYPEYNFNLARLVKYTNDHIKDLKVIDIGANIGDTVAYIKNMTDVPILCIDGDSKYLKILSNNVAKYNNVLFCHSLVGASDKNVNLTLTSKRGTAYLEKSNKVSSMRTLDNILMDFPNFSDSRFIKIDTDGFDTIILRSCKDFLIKMKPILFFEFVPELIRKNEDDPFNFMDFLIHTGYKYFMFYTNVGDFLISCSSDQKETLTQLVNYFSGRDIELFADICAFSSEDEPLFNSCLTQELKYFKKNRNF